MATTKYVSKIKNGTDIINIKDAEARTSLSSKVDKVDGKGLSTNDFTTALKNKLDGIASGATANTGTVTKVSTGTGLTGGDITTTGTISLATSGVTAGTYKQVTVDAYGRVTGGDNTDNNTTYTFTGGTNKFTVTPSGGTAQDVTVTPSISNNVTANGNFAANAIIVGNAANQVAKNSGVTISTAAPSSSSADTTVPTSKAVWSAIDALPEPMVFKGSLGTGGTITALPVNGTANIGDTYKVITAGTYASQAAKIGDVFICSAKTSSSNSWTYIPSADEPNGTVTSVKIAAGTGLSVDDANAITTSGTRTISLSSASQTSLGKADTAIQTITAAAGSNIGSVGTPSVTASTSNNATTLTFNYLKGAKGDKGDAGTTPTIAAAAGSNIGTVGTPSVTASTSGTTTTFTFNYLKGAKGDPGQNATTTSVFSASANGLAPAASNGNKTTAETAVGNYYLCADGKYRQLPANAFKNDNTWTAASTSAAGYVPAATKGKFLHSNASTGNLEWVDDNNTTYTPQKLGIGIGTCSTAAATAAKVVTLSNYELVTNGIVAVTFQYDVPAGATLNINSKGAKAIYYKGAAITADTIKAGDTVMFAYNGSQYVVTSLGGGASVNPNETVNISLSQIGGNSADLTGAGITITNDDTGDTIYTGIWAGTVLTTEIDVNTNYTVSVNGVTGYFVHHKQSYTAVYQNTRHINFNYAVNGIYIEDTDGNLYTNSGWNPNKTANSIVFGSDVAVYRIALSEAQAIAATSTSTVNTFKTYLVADTETGYVDKSKRDHTRAVSANKACDTYSAFYSAPYCDLYTFPNGKTGGLLPSTDILIQIINNKTNINQCLNTAGGIVFSDYVVYRSSTYNGNLLFGIASPSAGGSNCSIDATTVAGYNINTRAIAEY